MNVEVLFLPRDVRPEHLDGKAVVVFDVLRATTSMAAAIVAGVPEIHIFPDLAAARHAASTCTVPRLLSGEEKCLAPADFDLGNSPGAFTAAACAGRRMLMSTTNGTRAILVARKARHLFVGALVNAKAVAKSLKAVDLPVTLLCAGTDGQIAMEDVLGTGAVLQALQHLGPTTPVGDTTKIANRLFAATESDLLTALSESQGGRNITAANLTPDIEFAARLDVFDTVGVVTSVDDDPPVVRAAARKS